MIELFKQAGFKVCRDNANLYLEKDLPQKEGQPSVKLVLFFVQEGNNPPYMTAFERTTIYNQQSEQGFVYDRIQDDQLRFGYARVESVQGISTLLRQFGYEFNLPEGLGQENIDTTQSPIQPTTEQVKAKERIVKESEELKKSLSGERVNQAEINENPTDEELVVKPTKQPVI